MHYHTVCQPHIRLVLRINIYFFKYIYFHYTYFEIENVICAVLLVQRSAQYLHNVPLYTHTLAMLFHHHPHMRIIHAMLEKCCTVYYIQGICINPTARVVFDIYAMYALFCFLRGRRRLYYNAVSVAVTVLLLPWLLHLRNTTLQHTVLFSFAFKLYEHCARVYFERILC